jgi:hypothetical protein
MLLCWTTEDSLQNNYTVHGYERTIILRSCVRRDVPKQFCKDLATNSHQNICWESGFFLMTTMDLYVTDEHIECGLLRKSRIQVIVNLWLLVVQYFCSGRKWWNCNDQYHG